MSQVIEVGALLYPKADKLDRVMELFTALCDHVKATEPGALTYQCYTTEGENLEPMIVFLEKYENRAAFDNHLGGEKFAEVFGTIATEGLMDSPHKIFFMKTGPGWTKKD